MDSEEMLVSSLRRENFCVMTNEDGTEIYDVHGNLIVCNSESGEMYPIPNTEAIRLLYDLPLDTDCDGENEQMFDDTVDTVVGEDDNNLVWMGQRTEKCCKASRVLIELYNSPKFQEMMNDKSMVKSKIWEKIAADLEARGYQVDHNTENAGRRTFQRWRNMVKSYLRYLKNPEEFGEHRRKKKPYFFDDLHAILSKRSSFLGDKETCNGEFLLHTEAMMLDTYIDGNNEITVNDTNNPEVLGQKNSLVWLGQRTERCKQATKALIELYNSPKYQEMINDKGLVKAKVWEKIAADLQNQGFQIGNTIKIAGHRTFQKWRNMVKTYLRYLSRYGEKGFKSGRKKKPYFFDDLHAILSIRKKYLKTTKMCNCTQSEPLSKPVVHYLLNLIKSSKYKNAVCNAKIQKQKVWESIYDDITAAGYHVAQSRKLGAVKLSRKWKHLQKRLSIAKESRLRQSIIQDMSTKSLPLDPPAEPNVEEGEGIPSGLVTVSLAEPNLQKMEEGENIPSGVKALLQLIGSVEYKELLNENEKNPEKWQKIYKELEALGFRISGETEEKKSLRLFNKWRNTKREFIKYQLNKCRNPFLKKPAYYDQLLNLFYNEIVRGKDIKEYAVDLPVYPKMGHDYITPQSSTQNNCNMPGSSMSDSPAIHMGNFAEINPTHRPVHEIDYKTVIEILGEIRDLHLENIANQQKSFDRIYPLLKEQVKSQSILNRLIALYLSSLSGTSKVSRSKKYEI